MSNAGCGMGKTTIEWATDVWNPVTGCTPVSAGCVHCYAAGIAKRFWGDRKFSDVQCHEDRLKIPGHWIKPRRIFVNSMSDLFHDDVSNGFIYRVWGMMAACKRHTFMVLTKRPRRMCEILEKLQPLSNVWLGVSVEDQRTADERIPLLLQMPAEIRFVSCEPLLGSVYLGNYLCETYIRGGLTLGNYLDWVIVGGETGKKARPMMPEWAHKIHGICQDAKTPFFFKGWGDWIRTEQSKKFLESYKGFGMSEEGRLLDGKEWNEMPDQLSGKTGEVKPCENGTR